LVFAYTLHFIGLLETIKKDCDNSFFRKLDPNNIFFWKWVHSTSRTGGILCGVRNDSLEANAFKADKFMLQIILWDRNKKCNWVLIVVYGAAQEEAKE
jgi:hypothetical protein